MGQNLLFETGKPNERLMNQDMRFDGATYDPKLDKGRLKGQTLRVFNCMKDSGWRTLAEIESVTGDPQSSISARLRDLRKERFGGHTVERRRRGKAEAGLYEYMLKIS